MEGPFSFLQTRTASIFLVFISAFVLVIIISNSTGFIKEILNKACERYPEFLDYCHQAEIEGEAREITTHSTEALVCAINSVAKKENRCIQDLSFDAVVGPFESMGDEVYYTVERELGTSNEDRCTVNNDSKCYEELCGGMIGCEVVKAQYHEKPGPLNNVCRCAVRIPKKSFVDCRTNKDGNYVCKVNNFRLPQHTTKWNDWIPWFGDPEFLVYWQQFPMDEDTWSTPTDWRMYAVMAVISVVPPLKAGRMVVGQASKKALSTIFRIGFAGKSAKNIITKTVTSKTVKKSIESSIKNAMKKGLNKDIGIGALNKIDDVLVKGEMSKVRSELAGSWAGRAVSESPELAQQYAKESAQRILSNAGLKGKIQPEIYAKLEAKVADAAAKESLKYLGTHGLRQQFEKMIIERLGGRQAPATVLRFGTYMAAAWAVKVADSMTNARFGYCGDEEDEYKPCPNTILLSETIADPVKYGLVPEMDGRPVMVTTPNTEDWVVLPQLIDAIRPMHLVSPCHLSYIEVGEIDARCEFYNTEKSRGTQTVYTCMGKIKATDKGQRCDSYEVGNMGPFEFIDRLDEMPAYMSVLYNDLVPADGMAEGYYIIPFSENLLLYYKPDPESFKIGEAVGETVRFYDVVSDGNKYKPVNFNGVKDIEIKEIDPLKEKLSLALIKPKEDALYSVPVAGSPSMLRVDVYCRQEGDSGGGVHCPNKEIKIDIPDIGILNDKIVVYINTEAEEKVINMQTWRTAFDPYDASITLYDEVGDGLVHRIDVETPQGTKTLKEYKDEIPGFDKVILTNCVTRGVILEMGEKIGSTYCTKGMTTGKAWVEYGGDLLVVGSIVASVFSAGSLSWTIPLAGLVEVGTQYGTDKMGNWPKSW